MPGPFLPGMPMALNRMMMRGRALTPTNANANLSLSGLLNCIDGVESAEGRILIMTTNDLDGLDPALIRAGRVDVFFEYKKATRDQARQLFVEFYRDGPSEREYAKASKAPPSAGLEEREDDVSNLEKEEVTRMAEGWSQWVDDGEFTIATLQGECVYGVAWGAETLRGSSGTILPSLAVYHCMPVLTGKKHPTFHTGCVCQTHQACFWITRRHRMQQSKRCRNGSRRNVKQPKSIRRSRDHCKPWTLHKQSREITTLL